MEIRKFIKEDSEVLKGIFEKCFNSASPLRLINPLHRLVASDDNKIVGGAGLKYSQLHNKVVEIYIAVLPEYQRKKIGSKLHNALIENFPLNKNEIAFDSRCFEGQFIQQCFMKKLGYQKYLDCHSCIIDLDQCENILIEYEVKNYSDFLKQDGSLESVKDFLIQRYIEEHSWSPPREISHEIWKDIIEDIRSQELSVLITNKDQILGASEAREDFSLTNEKLLAIGWSYVQKNSNELKILKNLLFTQFNMAKEAGHKNAYMEIDSTESIATEILKWLPIKKMEIVERYRLVK